MLKKIYSITTSFAFGTVKEPYSHLIAAKMAKISSDIYFQDAPPTAAAPFYPHLQV